MHKTFKKAIASVMAMVMTVGLAASVNAAAGDHGHSSADIARGDLDCKHLGVYKVREDYEHKFTSNHTITVTGQSGNTRQENCVIETGNYNYYFYCKYCGVKVGYAGAETVSKHSNSLCPSY